MNHLPVFLSHPPAFLLLSFSSQSPWMSLCHTCVHCGTGCSQVTHEEALIQDVGQALVPALVIVVVLMLAPVLVQP